MKRPVLGLLMMVALAACASPLAKPETPTQRYRPRRSGQASCTRRSLTLVGNVKMTFPPQLGQMFGQSGSGAGSVALDMTGSGEASSPTLPRDRQRQAGRALRSPPKSWSPTVRPT